MKIVTFSGLDGSGKTTQINLFKKYLKEQGLKYQVIHIVKNSIANKLLKPKKKKKSEAKLSCKPKNKNKSKGFFDDIDLCVLGVVLRKIALLIDAFLFRFSKLKYKKLDVLICDRYFYDYLINIYYLEDEIEPLLPPFLRHLIVKPDLAVYFKIDPNEANQRKTDQGLDYLIKKQKIFENLKKELGFKEIESKTGAQKEIAEKVVGLFNKVKS
jgi:dTMP kinase